MIPLGLHGVSPSLCSGLALSILSSGFMGGEGIPDPRLHAAHLIVLWLSHVLFGRKPAWSVCPQLCKLLSTIRSQATTTATARQSTLLSFPRQGWESLLHTCSQIKGLNHTAESTATLLQQQRYFTLCHSAPSKWEQPQGQPDSITQHVPALGKE